MPELPRSELHRVSKECGPEWEPPSGLPAHDQPEDALAERCPQRRTFADGKIEDEGHGHREKAHGLPRPGILRPWRVAAGRDHHSAEDDAAPQDHDKPIHRERQETANSVSRPCRASHGGLRLERQSTADRTDENDEAQLPPVVRPTHCYLRALLLAQIQPDRPATILLAVRSRRGVDVSRHNQVGPPVAVPVGDAEPLDVHVGLDLHEELPLVEFGQTGTRALSTEILVPVDSVLALAI